MFDKEGLLKIANLNIGEELEQMNDNQLNEYVEALNSFIDRYSALEEKTKTDLDARDGDSIFEDLMAICDMLRKVRADVLAEECLNQINNLGTLEEGKKEAYITNFLAAVSMLSIDIQMAMFYVEKEEKKTPPDAKKPDSESKRTSILAVDDVTFFLNALQEQLKVTGYKLTCVNSGASALRFLRNNTPDLFLLDIDMPEMNGFELAREIRAIGQKGSIIFLTANSSHKHVMKAIEAGAVDFIVKPINRVQVINKIEKALSKKAN